MAPFRSLLAEADCGLSEHEIMTLGRSYSQRQEAETDLAMMLAVAQDHLRKKHFEAFADMIKVFTHEDLNRYCKKQTALSFTELHHGEHVVF